MAALLCSVRGAEAVRAPRQGLYKKLQGAGPVTASALAETSGLQERWLLEWLRGQAAAELLECASRSLSCLLATAAGLLAGQPTRR